MNIANVVVNRPGSSITKDEINQVIEELSTINSTIKVLDMKREHEKWMLLIDADFKEALLARSYGDNDDGYRSIGRIIQVAQANEPAEVVRLVKSVRRTHALSGESYDVKDILKDKFNARWDAKNKVWKVTKSNVEAAQAVIDVYTVEKKEMEQRIVDSAVSSIKEMISDGVIVEEKYLFKDMISELIDVAAVKKSLSSLIFYANEDSINSAGTLKSIREAKERLLEKGLCLISIEKIILAKNLEDVSVIDDVDFTNVCLVGDLESELKKALEADKDKVEAYRESVLEKEQEKLLLEEEERMLDEQLKAMEEEKQQKIRMKIKKISVLIDYALVREQAGIMIKNHDCVGMQARGAFYEAAGKIMDERLKLEGHGFYTKAIEHICNANFNRSHRDGLGRLTDEDYYNLCKI